MEYDAEIKHGLIR